VKSFSLFSFPPESFLPDCFRFLLLVSIISGFRGFVFLL